MQTPPRVHAFLWRSTQHCLPTRANLISYGILCEDSCTMQSIGRNLNAHFLCLSESDQLSELIGVHRIILHLLLNTNNFAYILFDLIDR